MICLFVCDGAKEGDNYGTTHGSCIKKKCTGDLLYKLLAFLVKRFGCVFCL